MMRFAIVIERAGNNFSAYAPDLPGCVAAGESIFARGDAGDELFLIRRGAVRIVLPLSDRQAHHLGTFGRGAFFGEMAFLDGEVRSANALAFVDTELSVSYTHLTLPTSDLV